MRCWKVDHVDVGRLGTEHWGLDTGDLRGPWTEQWDGGWEYWSNGSKKCFDLRKRKRETETSPRNVTAQDIRCVLVDIERECWVPRANVPFRQYAFKGDNDY